LRVHEIRYFDVANPSGNRLQRIMRENLHSLPEFSDPVSGKSCPRKKTGEEIRRFGMDRRFHAILAVFCLLVAASSMAAGQSPTTQSEVQPKQAAVPAPEGAQTGKAPEVNPRAGSVGPWLFNPLMKPSKPLTASQKFTLFEHRSFGPPAFVSPAISAGFRMARPRADYPRDWKDGAGAFGRLYGSTVATQASRHSAEFLTEAAFHYDPRYFPSRESNGVARVAHALAFVVVQRTDSGATSLALPHFAGAAAGGFVGMAYLPPGYNDLHHAGNRAASELLSIGVRNLAFEFAPELYPLERKLHIPRVVPAWWTSRHASRHDRP
jgi:hypothetical protein